MRRIGLCLLALALLVPAGAGAKTVQFRGEAVTVPAGWQVIRLAEKPRTCVRMDRKVVYLGTPSSEQRCPVRAIGRQRAILVDPGAEARAARDAARASSSRVRMAGGSQFTGLGFDACTAPSRSAMAAWLRSSPFRAVGVYIGGRNRACSQPNLTANWVSEQISKGWHLIPTYVGLQATTSSCTSCAKLSPTAATLQGTAEADDAVAAARALGLGSGSPIYNDMEGYTRTASATGSTLTYLAAWTNRLHQLGYDSGVYSSSSSGIRDLASRWGTGYPVPDDLWIANWNGRKDTYDPFVPSYAWANHQRIHQYRGGHNETWGGVTINIDSNYVEGATAGVASGSPDDPQGQLDAIEASGPGQLRVAGWAFDPNRPRTPVSIRVQLSGGPAVAKASRSRYELGPIANQPRVDLLMPDSRVTAPGFDHGFPVVGSGKQRVCVVAVNIGRGADRQLGCRGVRVPVPIAVLNVATRPNSARVTLRCEWPAGTRCPGQILMRAKQRVRVGSGRRARTRIVMRAIARRGFQLTGGRQHSFWTPLSTAGRRAVKGRTTVRPRLVIAIPGGRAVRQIQLR